MLCRARIWHATLASANALSNVYGRNFIVRPTVWARITEKNREDGTCNDKRYLRLAIESGGCHGFLYKFSFEPSTAVDLSEDYLVRADMHEVTSASKPAAKPDVEQASGEVEQQSTSGKVSSMVDATSSIARANGTGDVGSSNTAQTQEDGANCPPCIVVDKITVSKMVGAVVDYHRELKGAAFVVVGNELVDQSCACAMSFSLKRRPKSVPGRRSVPNGIGCSDGSNKNSSNSPHSASANINVSPGRGGVSVGTPISRRS